MIQILRQLSIEELRYAAAACSAGADVTPEGIVRAVCRDCNILGWGFVPLAREDALLEQVGQRLGVPEAPKGPRGVPVLERRVFAGLLRRAWEAADPAYQRSLLETAGALWDSEHAPVPELPPHEEPLGMHAAVDGFLARTPGLRALAAATESVPLVFPGPPADESLFGFAVGPLTSLKPRADRGYPALFEVLKICWRARRRLLVERRAQHLQLERQARQLAQAIEQRVADLRGTTAPWNRQGARGAAVAGGALAATAVQLALGVSNPFGWIILAAGLTWGAVAWASQPKVDQDPRFARLQKELAHVRQQLQSVHQSIAALEAS